MRTAILIVVLLLLALPVRSATVAGVTVACCRKSMTFDNWLFWWEYNKADLLPLKAGLKAREGPDSPTVRAIQEKIVPALERILANREFHLDIRGSALIALARAEPSKKHFERFMTIAAAKDNEPKIVRESSILALAICDIPDREVRDFLLGIAADREDRLRVRCFAILALGLSGDTSPEVARALDDIVTSAEAHRDLAVCALHAIGTIGDRRSAPRLLEWLSKGSAGRRELEDLERSWVVAALGRIGVPATLQTVSRCLRAEGAKTRRSAAIAIGQIALNATAGEQRDAVATLDLFRRDEQDNYARSFAMMSLGRIAGDERASALVRREVVTILTREFRELEQASERAFVALAMGLVGRVDRAGDSLRASMAMIIRPSLAKGKGDKVALSAHAVALGLLRDRESVGLLTAILSDRGRDWQLRSAAAIGLGLIGDPAASETVLEVLVERENRDLKSHTAIAAGLLGDPAAVDLLVASLRDRKSSQFVLGSTALALGQIGDHRAIDSMLEIIEPKRVSGNYPDLTRALVIVALGQIADRRVHPLLFRLKRDVNYRATVNAIDEMLSIL